MLSHYWNLKVRLSCLGLFVCICFVWHLLLGVRFQMVVLRYYLGCEALVVWRVTPICTLFISTSLQWLRRKQTNWQLWNMADLFILHIPVKLTKRNTEMSASEEVDIVYNMTNKYNAMKARMAPVKADRVCKFIIYDLWS